MSGSLEFSNYLCVENDMPILEVVIDMKQKISSQQNEKDTTTLRNSVIFIGDNKNKLLFTYTIL